MAPAVAESRPPESKMTAGLCGLDGVDVILGTGFHHCMMAQLLIREKEPNK